MKFVPKGVSVFVLALSVFSLFVALDAKTRSMDALIKQLEKRPAFVYLSHDEGFLKIEKVTETTHVSKNGVTFHVMKIDEVGVFEIWAEPNYKWIAKKDSLLASWRARQTKEPTP